MSKPLAQSIDHLFAASHRCDVIGDCIPKIASARLPGAANAIFLMTTASSASCSTRSVEAAE